MLWVDLILNKMRGNNNQDCVSNEARHNFAIEVWTSICITKWFNAFAVGLNRNQIYKHILERGQEKGE